MRPSSPTARAGGAGGNGSVGFGGGLEVSRGCVLTLYDSTFSHNAAIGGAGGSGAAGGNAVGGGVAVDRGSTATITDITVDHNQAIGGAGDEDRWPVGHIGSLLDERSGRVSKRRRRRA